MSTPTLNEYIPLMYRTGIRNKNFIVIVWLIGFISGSIGFAFHNRPFKIWLTNLFPQHIALIFIYALAYYLANITHKSIYDLYSIDISIGKFIDIDSKIDRSLLHSDLEDIFSTSEEFDNYQRKVYQLLTNRKKDWTAGIIGFILIIIIQVSDRLGTDYVAQLGTNPNPVDLLDPLLIVISIITILTQGFLAIGLMSALFLLLGFVQATAEIGENNEISMDNIINPNNNQEGKENTFEYIRRSELAQFSIKRFRRKCYSIPHAILPINLVLLVLIILVGVGILYFIGLRGGNETLEFFTVSGMIIFIIMDFYLFFFPQLSLHRIIKFRKYKTIDSLEEHYEIKKYKWLNLPENTTFETKQTLYNEIRVLANFIEEIEHLLSWPFDYRQFLTILASFVLTILLLMDILNFVSFVENISE